MYLLQAVATTSTKEYLLQYGVLGLVAFVLGYFAWMQYQRLVKKNDQLEEKVDKLQEQMMILLVEERDRLSELIRENTQALAELQKTILKYIVKGSLHKQYALKLITINKHIDYVKKIQGQKTFNKLDQELIDKLMEKYGIDNQ